MKTRKAMTLVLAATAMTMLAACGSSTTASAPATPAPAAVSASPAPSTCPQFLMTAAHMSTYWQYLNLNLGTKNDEHPTLDSLNSGVADLQRLAPTCAPKAVSSIAAFATTVDTIRPLYTTQGIPADVPKVQEALASMQKAGIQMFADLGQSDYAWK